MIFGNGENDLFGNYSLPSENWLESSPNFENRDKCKTVWTKMINTNLWSPV